MPDIFRLILLTAAGTQYRGCKKGVIEEIASQAIKSLLSQGTGWVVAVITLMGGVFVTRFLISVIRDQVKQLQTVSAEKEKEIRELYEKRFADGKETLAALNRSSAIGETMKVSIDARASAFTDMTAGFTKFINEQDARAERWQDFKRAMELHMQETSRALQEINHRLK